MRSPSPFAAALLFNYVANYIYEGDAPLAERRAQALALDQAQLRELIGEAELRDVLDAGAIESVELDLQLLRERWQARSADGLHDLLLRIGDLTRDELAARAQPGLVEAALPAPCATCARPAARVYTPPGLHTLPAAVREGLAREERSRHEPRIASRAEMEGGAPLRRSRRGSPPWALGG